MMKQTLSLVALAVVACFPTAAVGQTVPIGVRVIFNRGVEDVAKTCTEADWLKVEQALDAGYAKGRRLGQASASENNNNERHLMSEYCRRVCSGWPAGMCWRSGTGCTNRRLVMYSESAMIEPDAAADAALVQMEEAPTLVDALDCNEKQANLLIAISDALQQVNESCRKMIMSNHWLTCYYDV